MKLYKGLFSKIKKILSAVVLCFVFHNSTYALSNPSFELIRYKETGEYDKQIFNQLPVFPEEFYFIFSRYFYDSVSNSFSTYTDKYFPVGRIIIESSGFYSPELDNGSWIENLFEEMEQERIIQEVDNLNSENAQLNEDIERVISESIDEIILKTKDKTLSVLNYDEEIFMPSRIGDSLVTVTSSSNETIREFYDSQYRPTKKEYWEITSIQKSKIIKTEEYVYKKNNIKPNQKIILGSDFKEVINYNNKGSVVLHRKYYLDKDLKTYLLERHKLDYNKENQLSEDVKTTYTYNSDYTEVIDSFVQKHQFVYNGWKDIPADEDYYEDGELKLRTKYTQKEGTYTTQVFFDQTYSVKTYYENNEKTKEVFTMNDKVMRVRNYEKK